MRVAEFSIETPTSVEAENQIAFAFMSESDMREARGGVISVTGFGAGLRESGLYPIIAGGAAVGAVVIALVASRAAEPLLVTLLGFLAMLGTFSLLGFAAGHIRVGERVREDDLIRALVDGLEDGVLVSRQDGTPVFANTALYQLAGLPVGGDVSGLEALLTSEPKAAAAFFRLMRALDKRAPWAEEIEVRERSGRGTRLLRVAHRPCAVPGHEGELGRLVLWTFADVSVERERHAHEMQGLAAQLESFDGAPAGLMEVDAHGIIRRLNLTFVRWLGLEPTGLAHRGLRLADLVSHQDIEQLGSAAAEFHTQTWGAGVDLRMKVELGQALPLKVFVKRQPHGGLLISAFPHDEALDAGQVNTAAVRYSRVFQSAPFGIATVAPDGTLVSSNGAFSRMVATGRAVAGMQVATALASDGDTLKTVEAGIRQALSGVVSTAPIDITSGAHNEFSRRLYVAPLGEGQSTREAAILYLLDATEQKALEAKFAQSSKMEAVGKLAGGIAHDFNNVLTAIIGFSDLLLQTHRPTDPAYRDISNIRSSATRAAGLVAKLLAFSRRQTLQTEALQLGEELTEWMPVLRRSLGETIDLKISSGRDLWYVKTDRTQLEHVLLNLANNARDAMTEGGRLTIQTRNISERESQKLAHHGMPVGEYVLIAVSDTGMGMPPEVMAKIFEPFFTTKGVGKGTGLGLATAYGIVKQSGGFIYPESQIGQGTTFRIYLPRHLPENDDEIPAQKAAKKGRSEDLTGTGRVLLVEDEDVVRSFAMRALKRQGYEVLEASSGVEALEVMAANEGRVDIVVSDVVMPEMDGPTLLKELRKKNPELKIIFVSGYPHEAFETSLDKDQHFAFLPKPFSLPQLAAKVKEELAR